MSEDEPKISLTESEVVALVDSRIAEREEAKQREAARIREALSPSYPPLPPLEPFPSELQAELKKALDSTKGDPEQATMKIMGRLNTDIRGRPVDPNLTALWQGVSWVKDVLHPETRMGLIWSWMRREAGRAEREARFEREQRQAEVDFPRPQQPAGGA